MEELQARQRNTVPSRLDDKDQQCTSEELGAQQRQHTLYSVVAEAIPIRSENILSDVESDNHHYSETDSLPPNGQALTQTTKETGEESPSTYTAWQSRRLLYYFVVPVAILLVVIVIVVIVLIGGSSSKSEMTVSSVPSTFSPTAAPSTLQSPTNSSNFLAKTLPPIDPSVSCLGVQVPVPDPMPPFAETGACRILRVYLEEYFSGPNNFLNWTATCSCVNTDTGAFATCRHNCWTCYPLRKICALQTDTYEYLNSFGFISESKIMYDYQCGRDDRILWTQDYRDFTTENVSVPCTMALNEEECNSCTTISYDKKFCGEYNCTNLDTGGEFNTCTSEHDFYCDSPFYEFFGATFAGDGRVPYLDIFLACPNDIPFPT